MNPRSSLRAHCQGGNSQAVRKCRACFECDVSIENELDIPLQKGLWRKQAALSAHLWICNVIVALEK
jgi:hypothetical protein